MRKKHSEVEDQLTILDGISAANERTLADLEADLRPLISDGKNWVAVYRHIQQVENERLFSPQFHSLTAWGKDFCFRLDCTESRLWDARVAGTFYESWAAQHLEAPLLEDLNVDPQNLVVIRRLAALDPSRLDALMQQLLGGQIKRADLNAEIKRLKGETDTPAEAKPRAKRQRLSTAEPTSTLPASVVEKATIKDDTDDGRSWRDHGLTQQPYKADFDALLGDLRQLFDHASPIRAYRIVSSLREYVALFKEPPRENGSEVL